jgi:hypothetical protein
MTKESPDPAAVAIEKAALKEIYRDILAGPVAQPAPRVDRANPPELILLHFELPREMVEGDL